MGSKGTRNQQAVFIALLMHYFPQGSWGENALNCEACLTAHNPVPTACDALGISSLLVFSKEMLFLFYKSEFSSAPVTVALSLACHTGCISSASKELTLIS